MRQAVVGWGPAELYQRPGASVAAMVKLVTVPGTTTLLMVVDRT
jgi:hypothetical protein